MIEKTKQHTPIPRERRDHMQRVGTRLRIVIEGANMTQGEAARFMNVSKQRLSLWLTGTNYPDEFTLFKFSIAKRIDLDYIYTGRTRTRPGLWEDAEDHAGSSATSRGGHREAEEASGRELEAKARHLVETHGRRS